MKGFYSKIYEEMKEIKRFRVKMNFEKEKFERRRRGLVSYKRNFMIMGTKSSRLYNYD